jgi:hypothetical protein
MRRLVVLLPLALAAFASTANAVSAPAQKLPAPNPLLLGNALALATPGRTPTVARLNLSSFASWGGQYFTPTGEPVTIQVSDSYAQDPARPQQWASFLGSLVHGPELTRLTLILAPLSEIQRYCSASALACYSPQTQRIAAPGDAPDPATSAEGIIAHEYGHHIANNRENPPWTAIDTGTKRWASYQQVCRQTREGYYYPGAEDNHYQENPGEGFAESYRVLNERRLGLTETPWDIVDRVFYPTDGALAALEQDISSPWNTNTVSTRSGRFARRGTATRTTPLTTPLDGNISVTLRTPVSLRARVDVLAGAIRLGTATIAGGTRSVHSTACGSRALSVRVTRLKGSGSYQLALSRP